MVSAGTVLGQQTPVPADLGGPGFEQLANELGYTTWIPTPEDEQHFGYQVWKGGSITTSISRFPLSFRPFFYGPNANFTENSYINDLVYETLLKVHPVTLQFVPSLASHWKISDDEQTFTFRIDPDARWSDGSPVTARDVQATYDLIMDESIRSPSLQASYRTYSRPIELSPYLVQVRCSELNWRNVLTIAASLVILQADEIDSLSGREFIERYQYNLPIGSGPYRLDTEGANRPRSYSFVRRPDWWQANALFTRSKMNFDSITFTVVVDNLDLEYELFLQHQTDVFSFSSLTTDKWVADTAKAPYEYNWVRRYRVFNDGPGGTWGYYFNTRRPPFNDVRVRKAIAHLLDRRSIIHDLLYDEYEPYDSWYHNTKYEYPENEQVDYDPRKAAALLAEAGWTSKDPNGILLRDGESFVVELKIIKPLDRFVRPFQATAREAGIDIRISYVDGNTMSEAMMTHNFEMVVGNYGGLVFPNPVSSLASSLANRQYTNNITGVADEELDQLIEAYRIAFDPKERVRILQQIDSIVTGKHLIAFWWHPKGIRLGVWDRFGFPPGMLDRNSQIGDLEIDIFKHWWVDPEKQRRLRDAVEAGESLDGQQEIIVNDYWKRQSP